MIIGCLFCSDAGDVRLFFPGHDGGIGGDLILIEEKIGGYSCIGIKREIISILQIIRKISFISGIDDRIDVIEIEGEL